MCLAQDTYLCNAHSMTISKDSQYASLKASLQPEKETGLFLPFLAVRTWTLAIFSSHINGETHRQSVLRLVENWVPPQENLRLACGQRRALRFFSALPGNLMTVTDSVWRTLHFIKSVADRYTGTHGHVFLYWNLALKAWKKIIERFWFPLFIKGKSKRTWIGMGQGYISPRYERVLI